MMTLAALTMISYPNVIFYMAQSWDMCLPEYRMHYQMRFPQYTPYILSHYCGGSSTGARGEEPSLTSCSQHGALNDFRMRTIQAGTSVAASSKAPTLYVVLT